MRSYFLVSANTSWHSLCDGYFVGTWWLLFSGNAKIFMSDHHLEHCNNGKHWNSRGKLVYLHIKTPETQEWAGQCAGSYYCAIPSVEMKFFRNLSPQSPTQLLLTQFSATEVFTTFDKNKIKHIPCFFCLTLLYPWNKVLDILV